MTAYFLIAILLGSLCGYLANVQLRSLANRIVYDIRRDAYLKMDRLSIDYFSKFPAGKITSYITNDIETVRLFYEGVLIPLFQSVILVIGAYIGLFIVNPELATIFLLFIPFLGL